MTSVPFVSFKMMVGLLRTAYWSRCCSMSVESRRLGSVLKIPKPTHHFSVERENTDDTRHDT